MAKAVQGLAPRKVPVLDHVTRLAGLEPFIMAA
jgi:5-methyltetrahydrofolate--homocysteine methyltransferase